MKRSRWALFGIILLGVLLRLFVLSQRGSLWFDEAFSVHFAGMDLRTMLSYLRFENNPPLYFILLHWWMKLFGNSEIAVRMLSMIFGIATIPLVYLLGVRLHSRTTGLFASFLMAISTFQVFYATETRMYSLYLFLALLAIWLFLKIGFSQPKLSFVFFAMLSALIWTHITAWMIIVALGMYLLIQSLAFEKLSFKQFVIRNYKFLTIGALLVLQFLPWAFPFLKLKIAAPLSQGYLFYIPPAKNFFLTILENFLVFGQDNAFIVTLVSILIVGLLWFAIRQSKAELLVTNASKAQLLSTRLLLCWLFVPLLIGFAFSNAIPRYFIAVAPALYLLMGMGFAQLYKAELWLGKAQLLSRGARWAIPLLTFALIFPDYPSLIKISHHEWDGLAFWVMNQESGIRNQESRTLVLINPHSEVLPFERYYSGSLPVVGFYPKDDADDRDTRIVKTNWISLNTKENVPRLRDVTEDYNQIFLITGGIDPVGRNLVPVWFWENGWRRGTSKEFGRMSVMVLEH